MLSSNFFVKYYFSLHFLMMFASWISQVLRINYFKWWTINFDLVMVRLLRMKPDGGVVYMRNANIGGEECCYQKSRRRSGGRDESLLVHANRWPVQRGSLPTICQNSILAFISIFYIFTNPNVCPTQPNLTFTIVQQYDYAKHDYILF